MATPPKVGRRNWNDAITMGLSANEDQREAIERFIERYEIEGPMAVLLLEISQTNASQQSSFYELRDIGNGDKGKARAGANPGHWKRDEKQGFSILIVPHVSNKGYVKG